MIPQTVLKLVLWHGSETARDFYKLQTDDMKLASVVDSKHSVATFSKASKVIIDFQYFTNNILSRFKWRFPILHKPFFSFWYRINYVIKKTEGVVGRGLGWHELGMDPNRWPLSQFHPKIPMIRRCSTILPTLASIVLSKCPGQASKW